ncbi:MAG: helix-turn-helix domain-containing protein [Bacillota bacterium]|nr:helix-turn-helix domain-containing protein [Bacillota bacterium]
MEGVTAAVEVSRSTGEQYMHMEDKALFDYGAMVGAFEYVEKAVGRHGASVYCRTADYTTNREAAPVGERYYSPDEVAEKYNVSGVVVRKWLREGKLKGFKLGGKIWRIPEAELDRFVQDGFTAEKKSG